MSGGAEHGRLAGAAVALGVIALILTGLGLLVVWALSRSF
jgi:hypothetical protein